MFRPIAFPSVETAGVPVGAFFAKFDRLREFQKLERRPVRLTPRFAFPFPETAEVPAGPTERNRAAVPDFHFGAQQCFPYLHSSP